MPKTRKTETGFEESMHELERIVGRLETGELPLEQALELFEEGIGLARRCQQQLEEAERKVELLLRERGEIKAVPFGSQPRVSAAPADDQMAGDFEEEEDEDGDDGPEPNPF